MLDIKSVYALQSKYSVSDGAYKDNEVSLDDYVAQCRIYLSSNLPDEYINGGWDDEKKDTTQRAIVADFVDKHKVKVEGYVNEVGILDTEKLLEDLYDVISGAYIIKEPLADHEIDEIQINDKNTIFVVRKGKTIPFVDSLGRVLKFGDNSEIHILLNKLIDDGTGNIPQFTEGMPLLNTKTAKHQYRVNAVHYSANTMDKPPANFPITTVVIRKFKEDHLELSDIIRGGACTEKMGRLIDKLGKADIKLFCVGPTGSGKTTLLRIIATRIPYSKRIIMIQNPTEITFFERDEYGRNKRNVVHWEVHESKDGDEKHSASMPKLISNALRATPDVILIGEMREPEEFYQGNRGMKTGHKTLGTFHAEGVEDGVERFADELSTNGGITRTEALRSVCKSIDIIIAQYKFEDGTRRIMEIGEVLGVDNNGEPIINMLFEFQMSGKVEIDEKGERKVLGEFVQLNGISKSLQNKLFKVGYTYEEIAEFIEVSKESEGD